VINVNRVKEQAVAYGHSEKREFAFLVAHSMLHLCGYDHERLDQEAVMMTRQETILNHLNITRE
jgi:probable rRNA maturation factor